MELESGGVVVRGQGSGVSSWSSELELESGRLDGRVERVEIFMQASRHHSTIIRGRSSIKVPDSFP